ncbi:MAG: nucleotide kinase domain-containing protein [Bacteroidota bacterium]
MASNENKIQIINKKKLPKRSPIYDTYWRFATERQAIFFKRFRKELPPWTNDLVLRLFKFTNVYRASDRVSQYLIQSVIYDSPHDEKNLFFRILLFKIFNKIETWELLQKKIGTITIENFSYTIFDNILRHAMDNGQAIYSGAYIMASGQSSFGHKKKHQNHLSLIEKMLEDHVYQQLQECKSMQEVYLLFLSYPTIGEFLAYQYATDMNYSSLTNFSENDFVKAGPGAKDGILKCFSDLGDYSFEDVICMMADTQQIEFKRLDLDFKNLWGRPLQKIDCQNIFCEVDKYSRMVHPEALGHSNRTRIKQKYIPRWKKNIELFYPPKWNINHLIHQNE